MQDLRFSNPSSSPSRPFRVPRRALPHLAVLALALTGLGCEAANSETATLAVAQQAVVEVYVTDWCPYCQRLEAFLRQNNVAYERKNIERSVEARAEHQALGGGGIPVTRINGREIIRGFKPDAIGKALGLETNPTDT